MCQTCTAYGRSGNFEFKVHGVDAKEVETVAKALIEKGFERMSSSPNININLSNSAIGVLNTGEIENVHSISVNVAALAESGNEEVAKALKELTEAVASSQEISSEERSEILENLEELSKQAALAREERAKAGVIKSILSGVGASIGAAAGLAKIWSVWGNSIRTFFGV